MTTVGAYPRNSLLISYGDVIAATKSMGIPYRRPSRKAHVEPMKIGWALPLITAGSGGINTIAGFARHLSDRGNDVTIYVCDGVGLQRVAEAEAILGGSYGLSVPVKKLSEYTESDLLIATAWETAYRVLNTETDAHKFYFIQDFEPAFYGAGSKDILAEYTYTMGFYGITAGRWLRELLTSRYGMECDYFDFGADIELYRPPKGAASRNRSKVCFYARPGTERRGFELGIMALIIFSSRRPGYPIELFGADVSSYGIPFPYVNRGVLTPAELAALYQESIACIALSMTNASLLPFELLAAGCIPIVNDNRSNRVVLAENAYVHYADPIPANLAEALISEVERPDTDGRASLAADSVVENSWAPSYDRVVTILHREVYIDAKYERK